MRRAEVVRYWAPAVVWSTVLLLMSGKAGGTPVTTVLIHSFLAVTFGPVDETTFEVLQFIVRKTVHVLAYGLAAYLDFRAVRGSAHGWTLRWSLAAVALAVVVASLDEWHQAYVPGRTGTPLDVVIDACGATLAQIALRLTGNR
ncbi:MAG TPA: VanZ family protein [Thermoanaerobaculia bacterium]